MEVRLYRLQDHTQYLHKETPGSDRHTRVNDECVFTGLLADDFYFKLTNNLRFSERQECLSQQSLQE